MVLEGRNIWVKTTTKNGQSSVSYHRVWDIGRFMDSAEKEAFKHSSKVEQVLEPTHAPKTAR